MERPDKGQGVETRIVRIGADGAPPSDQAPPIFIIGNGRSGTTLLRLMLSAHPNIHLTHEASFWLWERRAPASLDGEALLRFYIKSLHFRWLRQDPADVVRGLPQPLQRDQMKQVYARVMALQAARYGKTRFGDKTPSHSAHLKRLFEDFPGARVVRITRDPRAVVRSLVRMPWAVSSRLAASFLVEVESRHVEPFYDHMLNIRFEDLLAKPHGVMMQVLDYVGEPWDNAVLNHHLHLPDDTPPMPWFQRAEQARESFRPIDWSTHDPVEVRLLEWLTRRTMRLSNYHRAQLPTRVSRLRLFGRWLSELPAFGRSAMRVIRLARLLRNPMWDCTQEGMAMVKALNPAAWDAYPGFEWPDAPSLSEGWEQSLSDR